MKRTAYLFLFFILLAFTVQGFLFQSSGTGPFVSFSVSHGFYYAPFTVVLSSDVPGSEILYTTDGSAPSVKNGKKYEAPLNIQTTTILRAVAIDQGNPGTVATCSYLFPKDIIHQSNTPPGYPDTWGSFTDISGTAIADYEMDPEIVNHSDYKDLIIPALLSVPTLSIATNKGYLFSHSADPDTGGIYIYTGANGNAGDGWERPVSAELIIPGSNDGFQVNCGMRIEGGASRLAEKNPKHSFRLAFRSEYGPGKLKYHLFGEDDATNKFNGVVLRASYGNTWRHFDPAQRSRATHVEDLWAKDTQLEMGYVSAHSRYFHLYLNGIYWGLYNFSERLDDDFMASYWGGDKTEYDIVKDYDELADGNMYAWNYLCSAVNGNITDNTVYEKLIGNNPDGTRNSDYLAYVDPANLCDYMLINFYGGNNDWDHHNWVAGRNRVHPGTGFSFYCWDSEKILESVTENYVSENNDKRPSGVFRKLFTNAEFRLLFADRVNLHLANGGLLTPEPVTSRWMKRANEIDTALVAESARWGDYRRDVHPWNSGPYYLYTVNGYWIPEKFRLLTSYFPVRTDIVISQLKAAGMLPSVDAPAFNQFGGNVEADFRLKITAGKGCTIYYTLDGTDPRMVGGNLNSKAKTYNSPIVITRETEVKARAKLGNVWSALTAATFYNPNYQPTDLPVDSLQKIAVYPNPFSEFVYINYYLPENGNTVISVYQTDGRLVNRIDRGFTNSGKHNYTWLTGDLRPGIYLLQVTCGKIRLTSKIIKVSTP